MRLTSFWYCRLATPAILPKLKAHLDLLKKNMLQWERKTYPRQVIARVVETTNPIRPRYIHLYNLFTLLNFTIPSVQDYGVALKLADVELLLKAYIQLYITILNSNLSLY